MCDERREHRLHQFRRKIHNIVLSLRFRRIEHVCRQRPDVIAGLVGTPYFPSDKQISGGILFLEDVNALPMPLGLDLRGGVYFLLQVDMKGALQKKITSLAG